MTSMESRKRIDEIVNTEQFKTFREELYPKEEDGKIDIFVNEMNVRGDIVVEDYLDIRINSYNVDELTFDALSSLDTVNIYYYSKSRRKFRTKRAIILKPYTEQWNSDCIGMLSLDGLGFKEEILITKAIKQFPTTKDVTFPALNSVIKNVIEESKQDYSNDFEWKNFKASYRCMKYQSIYFIAR